MNTQLELTLLRMRDIINPILVRFKQMNNYAKHRSKLEKSTLINFAEWTVSPNADAINHLLENLFILYSGSSELRTRQPGILSLMSDNLKVNF